MRLSISPKLLGPLLAWAVRLWHLTLRVRRINTEVFMDPGLRAQRPVVILWHDEIFPLIPSHEGESMACVVSQSRDGELLAEMLRCFGFLSVRGSSSRGGMRALVAARRVMDEKGVGIIFTVDGPRGPRHKVKPGAIFLAARTGSPIVPVRAVMERAKIFHRAWDKFQLPWPFSVCTIVYGAPVYLSLSENDPAELDRLCLHVEQVMDSLGRL